jgi:hypothetical protein
MLNIRFAAERGVTQLEWLDSRHTFSFGDYYDPSHMGFHSLRVINQDTVKPGAGFATHSHKDMEIITYVLKGAVVHKDSLGNETIIKPGEIQRMSAGAGVTHSEYNHSKTESVELLQIWLLPAQKHLPPSYQQKNFDYEQTGLQLLVAPDGAENTLLIHQDAKMLRGLLLKEQTLELPIVTHKALWLQMISGQLLLNYQLINPGDGASITREDIMKLKANEKSEFLLFEL